MNTISGELYSTGIISALVPAGWRAYHGADHHNQFGGKATGKATGLGNPETIHIGKGAMDTAQLITKPRIDINFHKGLYSQLEMDFMRSAYDEVTDIAPFKFGNFSWSGYLAKTFNYPYILLFTSNGKDALQVAILLENQGETISFEDADVQFIMESIAIVQE